MEFALRIVPQVMNMNRVVDVGAMATRDGEATEGLPALNEREADHFRGDLYNSLLSGKPEGIAAERSQAYSAKTKGFRGHGVVVSLRDMCRALVSNNHTAGGAFIATDVQQSVEPALRAKSRCVEAGARVFTGLKSSFALPRATSGITWSWLPAIGSITPGTPVLAQVAGTPHRFAASTNINRQADVQSNRLASRFVFEDLLAGYAAGLDLAGLRGSAQMGEPCGITSNENCLTKTFSGAATAAILLDMIGQVASNNADDSAIGWILHPDVREVWATKARASNTSTFLYEVANDTVLGKRAFITTNASATGAICGDWTKLAFLQFGPDGGLIEFTTDPYSDVLKDEIRIVAETLSDVLVIRPTNFIYATDTTVA